MRRCNQSGVQFVTDAGSPKSPGNLTVLMSEYFFRSDYGSFQSRYRWLSPFLCVAGAVLVPVGLFANEGWKLGPQPLEPWAATLIVEVLAAGAPLAGGSLAFISRRRRSLPQRVILTDSTLVVPKGLFSNVELELPLEEIEFRIFDVGFVTQLQVKRGRQRVLLSSALFPDDADFDELVDLLLE